MKQYCELLKMTIKNLFAFRTNLLIGVFMSIIKIYLAFILWGVLYEGKKEIAGFTFETMVTYYIFISFFQKLNMTDSLVRQFASEIREGQFSKYLIKPTNPLWSFISQSFGSSIFVFWINVVGVIFFSIVFNDYFVIPNNLINFANALMISILGILFLTLLGYWISILSFIIYEVFEINLIKNGILDFLTGTMVPIILFPKIVQDMLQYLPVYYINFFPTMLLLDRETDKIYMAYIVLTLWNLLLFLTIKFSYARLLRRFEGVGI